MFPGSLEWCQSCCCKAFLPVIVGILVVMVHGDDIVSAFSYTHKIVLRPLANLAIMCPRSIDPLPRYANVMRQGLAVPQDYGQVKCQP